MPSKYRDHIRNIKHAAAVLDELKMTAGCVDCGFSEWPEALHFDHVDPDSKRSSLGWMADRSKLTTKARLNRYLNHVENYCVVRCANCHAHRTHIERQWEVRREASQTATPLAPTLF